MRKTSRLSNDKGETPKKSATEKSSRPAKKTASRIVDITDQFPGTSFIITGVEKPKQ
jgi:hypothetical protein